MIDIRPETPEDLGAKAALFRAARSRYAVTEHELRSILTPFLDGTADGGYAAALAWAGDRLVGAATLWQRPKAPVPGHHLVEVVTDPDLSDDEACDLERRFDDWLAGAVPDDAVELRASAYTDTERSMRWAHERGFSERTRTFRSTQRPAEVDLPDVELPSGWRLEPFVATVADLGRDEAWEQLAAVSIEGRADIPHGNPPPPEDGLAFRTRTEARANFGIDGVVVCRDDTGRIVGYTELMRDPVDPGLLHVGLTATARAARRRGVALALKVAATRLALTWGVERIETYNDEHNQPMLAINRRLGFVPDRVNVEFQLRRGEDGWPGRRRRVPA